LHFGAKEFARGSIESPTKTHRYTQAMSLRPKPRVPATRGLESPATPAAGRFDSLTGLRGVAALSVLFFHAWLVAASPDTATGVPLLSPLLSWLMRIGWSGVDVFFTLSAFLLALPYARAANAGQPAPAWRPYLLRRAARIFPAYWTQLAILLAAGLAGLAWGRTVPPWQGVESVIAHVVLWLDAWPRVAPLLPHWWTLPVEFGFYLLLPMLARAFAPRRWPWLLALVALAWAWRAMWLLHPRADFAHLAWIDQLPGRIDQFAIGMLAAWAWVRGDARGVRMTPRAADVLLVASAMAFLAMPALLLLDGRPTVTQAVTLHPLVLAWHSLASVAVAGMLVACVGGAPLAARLLASRPLRGLGAISYSLYLWHLPAIWWVLWQSGDSLAAADFWPYVSASLLLSLVLATLSWWAVERPVQAWARRR
jgi:peptidoglycan/LPS O-acetylase OafA/YrhL